MTAATLVGSRSRFRRLVERLLPWYDPAQTAQLHERTVAIGRESFVARAKARQAGRDAMRASFTAAQRRLERR